MNEIFNDINYYPYLKGKYNVSPSFNLLKIDTNSVNPDNYFFQLDNNFKKYQDNKKNCRLENIDKYYQELNLPFDSLKIIIDYIITNLTNSYPNQFILKENDNLKTLNCLLTNEKIVFDDKYRLIDNFKYKSLADAIISQIQEDLAICSIDGQKDYLSLIHLCSPSYWSAQEKIGENFSETHQAVPGMEKIRGNYNPLLEAVIKKGPFFRFAWEISPDDILNHHPDKLPDTKKFNPELPQLYARVERQCLVGFSQINTFIFTIKTYYKNVLDLTKDQIHFLNKSLLSMPIATLKYKRIENDIENISSYLKDIENNL